MINSQSIILKTVILFSMAILAGALPQQCNKPDAEKIMLAQAMKAGPAPGETCVLVQHCFRGPDDPTMEQSKCPNGADPTHINNPEISYFTPTKLKRKDSQDAFKLICPFMDQSGDLCCNDDQVEIMNSVFGKDCSICAANLKRMWCDYTCHPQKTKFVQATGYQMDPDDGNLTLTNFTVDPDYACTITDYEHSLIDNIHSCDELVPTNGIFDNYIDCQNCTCAYCDKACKPPEVSADIGFFDGFNKELVGISYGVLIGFTIIFQLIRHFCLKRKLQAEKVSDSDQSDSLLNQKMRKESDNDLILETNDYNQRLQNQRNKDD
ncbi:UNKNOWN [Stylonychia lemnae]|uniref:Niemann-Pick C1 N-terminal domain-containing protein n=1 Tax=Stylonychia lemnae TaxID=5949 RepID=A0A078B895_STYLE|nr:UNKNOWN [Stylonychia lemnae]|eukprot:CDW90740.1 UNKNOWN [Stylonychia lemnae]